MLTVPQTLDVQSKAARTKVQGLTTPGRLLVSGILAGAYIGIGVVLMVSAAGPLLEAGDGFAKLVSGVVFSAALTMVVFAGSELITSAMMIIPMGMLSGSVRLGRGSIGLAYIFAANFLGALIFAGLIVMTGLLESGPAGNMLVGMLDSKGQESALQLFTRGVLCNVLVCLAVWMGTRVGSAGARMALIFVAITAFVTSGFEHVVANMTTYWVGVFTGVPSATAAAFARNMVWVGLGNLVGGLLIAVAYWLLADSPRNQTNTRERETVRGARGR